jgi:hypothetical protein
MNDLLVSLYNIFPMHTVLNYLVCHIIQPPLMPVFLTFIAVESLWFNRRLCYQLSDQNWPKNLSSIW